MVVFFILYAVLTFVGIRFVKKEKNDVLSFDQTNALKGIGIMTVFFNHIYNDYLTPNNVLQHPLFDKPFILFESNTTALFVGMFLFFSGYGIFESYKKKGENYVKQMPIKRIGTTLLNFDIAVIVFVVTDLLLHSSLTIKQVLLSLIGWESVGNSNWYIFAIVYCYVISFFSMSFTKSRPKSIIIALVFIIIYSIVMSLYKQSWWYMTIYCYPCGLFYSQHKEKINYFFEKRYCLSILLTLSVLTISIFAGRNPFIYNLAAISFSILCVLFSMKVRLNSKPLIWLGMNLFPLYIYQRLPMLVIENLFPSLIKLFPFLFVVTCISITLIIGRFVPTIKLSK